MGATYHVTRATETHLYGHETTTCDPSGCAGFEVQIVTRAEDADAVPDYIDETGEEVALCECSCSADGGHVAAATTDSDGMPVCDECSTYYLDADDEVVCSRTQTSEMPCRHCDRLIVWGSIETHQPGQANTCEGRCSCRHWLQTERGGQWELSEGDLVDEDYEITGVQMTIETSVEDGRITEEITITATVTIEGIDQETTWSAKWNAADRETLEPAGDSIDCWADGKLRMLYRHELVVEIGREVLALAETEMAR